MFKSPYGSGLPKKGIISFNKMSASPRACNNSKKIMSEQREFNSNQFTRTPGSILTLEISGDKFVSCHKCLFPFNSDTTIADLMVFLKKEVQSQFVYFTTRNLNLDFLLTLKRRKVKQLNTKRLELSVNKIKISRGMNALRNFQIINCVGTGGFSRVYLCRAYGKLMALKAINKQFIVQNMKQNIVENERTILEKCCNHPFITKLYTSFETQHYLIFCMEYCNGGQLFNLLRKVRRMSQEDAKFYFLQTLSALAHLHSEKILYRDLKPQNIIIDDQGHIRLADYGLSKVMDEDMTHSFCGSAQYMAPEMLQKKGHSFEIDYYCLGALLYQLLFGLPPYYSRNQSQLFNNILTKDLQFPSNIQISKQLKKFLHRMLQKNTDLRFKKISQIINHPWLKDVNMTDVFQKKLVPPFKTEMFESNFDSSDFQKDEGIQILKLEKEKDLGQLPQQQVQFIGFYYISQELKALENDIATQKQKRHNFSKKVSNINPQPITIDTGLKSLIRSSTMKSIDTSQFNRERQEHGHQQLSPRVETHQNHHKMLGNSRSGQKLKVFVSQTINPSKVSPAHHNSGTVSHPSYFHSSKGSELLNSSKQSSGIFQSSSGSKLVEVRSVPFLKNQGLLSNSPAQQRMNSPININNYINIYTSKSPPKKQPVSFTSPPASILNAPPVKKPMSNNYGHINASYQKNYVNNSYRNGIHQHCYASLGASLERAKFSSLDKPAQNGTSFLRNAYYQNASPAGRGYLTNFKERMNPNQKIKKTYRNNQKTTFNNFLHPTSMPLRRA